MKIQLVTSSKEGIETQEFETSDLIAAMEARGFKASGASGGRGLRPEPQGQPGFVGLCGPMWGGDGKIRYEDWATYEIMSN